MSILSVIGIGGLLAGCAAPANTNNGGAASTNPKVAATNSKQINLVEWTYYANEKLAVQQFEKIHPNIHITLKVFPGSDYETKLQAALSTGTDVPDIFDLDMGYIGKFINTPYVADLSKLGANSLVKGMIPYVAAGGEKSNGDVGAITDTSSPGGFWFNMAAAKKWLGTNDPNKVATMVNSWSKIESLGKKINQESKGKVHLLDDPGSVFAVEEYHTQNLVQNGKLVIDPKWNTILNTMRTLAQPGLTANLPAMGTGWGNSLNDHSADPDAILFAIPSWAGFMVNSTTANGKYGVVPAPDGYYEGGRYAAIYAGSKNQQAAYEYLQFLASPQWQKWNLDNTANMPSLKSVYTKYENTYTYPWFGNQKILKMYYKISMDIPPQKQDEYEQPLVSDFLGDASTMVTQKKSNQWAIQQLKAQVQSSYPEVKVD